MDGLEAIGNLILGFVNLLVFISSFLVRGIVWVFALIANLFGWELGHNFVHQTMLGLAVALSAYLGVGYLLISQGLLPNTAIQMLYSGVVLYPLIILTGIIWVGYFSAPAEITHPNNQETELVQTDLYNMYFATALMVMGIVIVSILFIGARHDYFESQKRIAKQERCIESRKKTGDKLTSLADKIGIGKKTSEDLANKLSEACK